MFLFAEFYGLFWIFEKGFFLKNFFYEYLKIHETRSSQAHSSADDERMVTRKQKAEQQKAHEAEKSPAKKAKAAAAEAAENNENDQNGQKKGKSVASIAQAFEEFCRATREHLTIEQMHEILEANGQDSSGTDDAVVPRW